MSAFDAHPDPLFRMVGILNVDNIHKRQIGNFIYLYNSYIIIYLYNTCCSCCSNYVCSLTTELRAFHLRPEFPVRNSENGRGISSFTCI